MLPRHFLSCDKPVFAKTFCCRDKIVSPRHACDLACLNSCAMKQDKMTSVFNVVSFTLLFQSVLAVSSWRVHQLTYCPSHINLRNWRYSIGAREIKFWRGEWEGDFDISPLALGGSQNFNLRAPIQYRQLRRLQSHVLYACTQSGLSPLHFATSCTCSLVYAYLESWCG